MNPTTYPFDHPDTIRLKMKRELAAQNRKRKEKQKP